MCLMPQPFFIRKRACPVCRAAVNSHRQLRHDVKMDAISKFSCINRHCSKNNDHGHKWIQ